MKQLKPTLTLSFLLLTGILFAQDIEYGYDAAGNRISRKEIQLGESGPQAQTPVQDKVGNIDVTIYPNPTQNTLTVNMDVSELDEKDQQAQAKMYLFDLTGKQILTRTVSTSSTQMDLSNQPPGGYILRIQKGKTFSEWKINKVE